MKCPRCQHETPAGQRFCGNCGTPLQPSSGTAHPANSYADVQRSLAEALARESATGEILRVIRSSPTDVQPVFDAVAESAARLGSGRTARNERSRSIPKVARQRMLCAPRSSDVL